MPLINANGIRFEYAIEGEGKPLVLLHGGQGDSSSFYSLVPSLSKHFKVLSFDQRGSGFSDKPNGPYTMELLADDTVHLMEALKIASAHIFGISMGGMVAQALALRHPKRVNSLILGCTLPGGWEKAYKINHAKEVFTAFSIDQQLEPEIRAKALSQVVFSAGFIDKNPTILNDLVQARKKKPIDPIGLKGRMDAVDSFDAFSKLKDIHCPTLIITGKDDRLVDWRNSKLLNEEIPHSKLLYFEHAGHLFWIEKPKQSLDAITSFIKSL